MKPFYVLVTVSLGLLPLGLFAQAFEMGDAKFYLELAEKDASYEHDLKLSEEDEADFWNDQHNFENGLKQTNAYAYLRYIYGKKKSYVRHQKVCDLTCTHSHFYYQKAAFYFLGKALLGDDAMTYRSKKKNTF
ncbi:MAG: hypothetical protein AAGB24_04555 [Bacteroidota bacterium]